MTFDAILLSRLQFAFTIAFHIIFPSFTIGLASFLAVLEGLWLATRREAFKTLYLFWLKIFAISFGMGVVTGVVMSYEFGTNWSVFSRAAAPVIGPLLAFEVLTAFFLESSFLGVMLLGWKKVGPGLHFAATCLVAIGTLVSAFWIISANSWMQFPTGYVRLAGGLLRATDWLAVIFSPTFPERLVHMVLAAYLTTALVVGAACAFALLKDPAQKESRIALRMAIGMYAIVAPLQLVVGDHAGRDLLRRQPSKLAAIEAFWDTKARGRPSTSSPGPTASAGQPLGDLDPEARQPDHRRRRQRAITGLKAFAPGRPAAGVHRLLGLPGDGRPGPGDDRPGPLGGLAVAAGRPGTLAPVPQGGRRHGSGRLRRRDRRLDGGRGRPPALGDLACHAHRRRGLAGRAASGLGLAPGLPDHLRGHLHRRRALHPAPDRAGPSAEAAPSPDLTRAPGSPFAVAPPDP